MKKGNGSNMSNQYTIGQLARAADVPASTVRYYERVGLLRPDNRSHGNYRLYGDDSLGRLRFIRAAQATGFTLDDISTLLAYRDGSTAACRDVQVLIEGRLADVEVRLSEMRHLRRVLKSTLKECQGTEANGECQTIDQLEHASASPGPKRTRR